MLRPIEPAGPPVLNYRQARHIDAARRSGPPGCRRGPVRGSTRVVPLRRPNVPGVTCGKRLARPHRAGLSRREPSQNELYGCLPAFPYRRSMGRVVALWFALSSFPIRMPAGTDNTVQRRRNRRKGIRPPAPYPCPSLLHRSQRSIEHEPQCLLHTGSPHDAGLCLQRSTLARGGRGCRRVAQSWLGSRAP
jgi:hypothetical protein